MLTTASVSTFQRYAEISRLSEIIDERAPGVDLCVYAAGKWRPEDQCRVHFDHLTDRIDLSNAAAEIVDALRSRAAQLLSAARALEDAA